MFGLLLLPSEFMKAEVVWGSCVWKLQFVDMAFVSISFRGFGFRDVDVVARLLWLRASRV